MWPVGEAGKISQTRQHGSTLTRSIPIEYIRDCDDQSQLNVRSHSDSLGLSSELVCDKYENTDLPHHEIESAYNYCPNYQLLNNIFLKLDSMFSLCNIICSGSYLYPLVEFEGDSTL